MMGCVKNFSGKFEKPLEKRKRMVYNIPVADQTAEYGGIAQLVRAFGSHPRGHRFEPYCLHQSKRPPVWVVFLIA